jgi:hypothetical protein
LAKSFIWDKNYFFQRHAYDFPYSHLKNTNTMDIINGRECTMITFNLEDKKQ